MARLSRTQLIRRGRVRTPESGKPKGGLTAAEQQAIRERGW